MGGTERWSKSNVIEEAGHNCLLECNRRAPFELDETGGCRVLRPGEEKYVLICNGFTQHLRLFLPAVDLVLIAPD